VKSDQKNDGALGAPALSAQSGTQEPGKNTKY
jgi:hypothetical protein